MSDIENIHELAMLLNSARAEKKQLEDRIKEINSEIKDIEEGTLSNLLDNQGISKISLDDMDISKSVVFRAPYTKAGRPEAFQFLYDSDNEGALKKKLIIDLDAYPSFKKRLDDEGLVEYEVEYSIHHATLSSIIKELVEAGKFSTEDIETYSIYVQPQVKVKMK